MKRHNENSLPRASALNRPVALSRRARPFRSVTLKRALVLGLLVGYAAGCGGSQPADPAQQTPETATDPGAPTVQESATGAPALGASSIGGTVTFDGEAPTLRPLDMTAEAVCHEKHGGKPAPNEALILGPGNTMGNIMVWVLEGAPGGEDVARSQHAGDP